ncbi:M15 family metallopeptidase [Candidatus Nomurabacteria bacterium]|nr:M15 family metallopeptidase [Candidatus Nomurabacteria bacterium]
MSKSMGVAIVIIWGVLALVIGAGVLHTLFASESEISQDTSKNTASQAQSQNEKIQEESLNRSNKQEENQTESSTDELSLPLSTLDLKRGNCPRPETLSSTPYGLRVDKENTIGEYEPSFLVDITPHLPTKDGRFICLDQAVALYLDDLLQAAKNDGHTIVITSGYRSYWTQSILREKSEENHGDPEYDRVAKPGHSEHQLGTAIDIAGATNGYISAGANFANTPEYQWMLEHAHEYGFILSYPEGKQDETGYIFEPWHWRFVGVENVDKFQKIEKEIDVVE